MSDLSPAARVHHLRETLDWASALLAAQPEPLRQAYLRTARIIVHALTTDARQLRVALPNRVVEQGVLREAPRPGVVLQVGSFLTRLRDRPAQSQIISGLQRMSEQRHPVVGVCARLTAFAAAQILLTEAINGDSAAAPLPAGTPPQPEAIEAARETVARLCRLAHWMRYAEELFPGWDSDDTFNETLAHLTARLLSSGRTLALWQTQHLMDDLHDRWRKGQFLNGLTVYVPYLDERAYEMAEYRLDVVPSARIPFHPGFLVSACRLAERDVRSSAHFSQATRWQLLSQLDLLVHTFDMPEAQS